MRKDKETAFDMRKQGKSYNEIRAALKIPKATLSDWFSKIDWSNVIAKKLAAAVQIKHTARIVELDRMRGVHLARIYEEAREEARSDLLLYRYNPLFIAGLMLYWGEGDKGERRSGLRLANTDPELVKLYVFFLLHVCCVPVEKIKIHILVYPDLNEIECKKYWINATGLRESNFTKSTVIIGRHKTRRLLRGVCLITVSSTYLKEKVLEWLRIFPTELMKEGYYAKI